MQNPRRARVVEQHFLNLPGFHAGAYVRAYVEDTSQEEVKLADAQRKHDHIPNPQLVLEIADCYRRIDLEFDVCSADDRMNAFHKIDTLISALQAFRGGLALEAALYRRRTRSAARMKAQRSGREAAAESPAVKA
ncbi:MAG TPA: hypothetical protein VIX82_13190 [Solirubrobacteraceae bacterium]